MVTTSFPPFVHNILIHSLLTILPTRFPHHSFLNLLSSILCCIPSILHLLLRHVPDILGRFSRLVRPLLSLLCHIPRGILHRLLRVLSRYLLRSTKRDPLV
ncbi:hypothetical protein Leryth_018387 [Lithospermum erythrorhizon]|nr:hypothetical protein Leryth_018387 [Lithospermum erythrorhizon]